MNMTNFGDMFSIETPTFILVHKILNASSLPFNMEIEKNVFKLPGFFNLKNRKNQTSNKRLIMLKVNFLRFCEFMKRMGLALYFL